MMGIPYSRAVGYRRGSLQACFSTAWRGVFAALLACVMVFSASPEARESLLELQQTSGLERLVEYEAARPERQAPALVTQRLEPALTPFRSDAGASFGRQPAPHTRTDSRTTRPRAPPHQPRAPPAV
jgi:hypothetical protein